MWLCRKCCFYKLGKPIDDDKNTIYMILTYAIITVILLAVELIYFRIADKCNIIDKPNERSSHNSIVLRGGD